MDKRKLPMSEKRKKYLSIIHKGKHYAPNTQFKKGHKVSRKTILAVIKSSTGRTPWNKGKSQKRFTHITGYVFVYHPNHPNCTCRGYVREHRHIMEQHIGRYLIKSEVVHHINDIKSDNRISNLKLFKSNSEHIKHNKLPH